MKGAALVTVIGQFVSFVISVAYFFHTKTFKLTKKSFLPNFKTFSSALKLGTSSFITQLTIVIISLICNIMLAKYGAMSHYGIDIPIAVIGIESKVFTVGINFVVGIVLGYQPIISYNMGAKKNIRRSDEARAAYYKNISGQSWGDQHNYDLLIDSSIGIENNADVICRYVMGANNKK